jgi:hypothetical protein
VTLCNRPSVAAIVATLVVLGGCSSGLLKGDDTDVGFVANVAVPSGTPTGIALVSDTLSPATEYRFAIED